MPSSGSLARHVRALPLCWTGSERAARDSATNPQSWKLDGSPGPNFAAACQVFTSPKQRYFIGVLRRAEDAINHPASTHFGRRPEHAKSRFPAIPSRSIPFPVLTATETWLEAIDLPLLTTGATGAAATCGAPHRDHKIVRTSKRPIRADPGPAMTRKPGCHVALRNESLRLRVERVCRSEGVDW